MDLNSVLDQLAYLYEDIKTSGYANLDQLHAIEEYSDSLVEWVNGGGFLPAFVTEPQPWTTDPNRWEAWVEWVLPQIDLEARARLDAPNGTLG